MDGKWLVCVEEEGLVGEFDVSVSNIPLPQLGQMNIVNLGDFSNDALRTLPTTSQGGEAGETKLLAESPESSNIPIFGGIYLPRRV